MNRTRISSGLLALVVLVSGLGLAVAPGAAATYDDGDESIVVQVDWDDVEVDDGDTAQLDVDGEMVDVTVRESTTTTDATYWVSYDDLEADPADGDEMTVAVATDVEGVVTLDASVAYVGAEHIDISEGEGIEAMIEVDEEFAELPVDVDLTVYDEDETTILNSTTIDEIDAEQNTTFHDFHPDIPENETVDVTVQIDHVDDGTDPAFEAVDDYQAELITVGILGLGGDDSTMIIVGIAIIGGVALLMRD